MGQTARPLCQIKVLCPQSEHFSVIGKACFYSLSGDIIFGVRRWNLLLTKNPAIETQEQKPNTTRSQIFLFPFCRLPLFTHTSTVQHTIFRHRGSKKSLNMLLSIYLPTKTQLKTPFHPRNKLDTHPLQSCLQPNASSLKSVNRPLVPSLPETQRFWAKSENLALIFDLDLRDLRS